MGDEVIFFDNSGLTRLFEEPDTDRVALVAALRTLGTLQISALNVYETARTPHQALRSAKLHFYRELGRDAAPVADPMALLAAFARNYCCGTRFADVDELAHRILLTPEMVTDEVRAELTEWSKDQERDFADMHLQIRTAFDVAYEEAAQQGISTRFRSEAGFLQMMFALPELIIHSLIAPPYQLWTDAELDPKETGHFLDTAPVWRVFVAAQLHALWLRSATPTVASWRRTGIFDTDSAAYLPLCDRFVTSDRAQLATLATANAFNPRQTKVEFFTDLKSRLLL
jgi:hypothetical protein